MKSPTLVYAGVGLLIGIVVTKLLISPIGTIDFVIGAIFGFFLGVALAVAKKTFSKPNEIVS